MYRIQRQGFYDHQREWRTTDGRWSMYDKHAAEFTNRDTAETLARELHMDPGTTTIVYDESGKVMLQIHGGEGETRWEPDEPRVVTSVRTPAPQPTPEQPQPLAAIIAGYKGLKEQDEQLQALVLRVEAALEAKKVRLTTWVVVHDPEQLLTEQMLLGLALAGGKDAGWKIVVAPTTPERARARLCPKTKGPYTRWADQTAVARVVTGLALPALCRRLDEISRKLNERMQKLPGEMAAFLNMEDECDG